METKVSYRLEDKHGDTIWESESLSIIEDARNDKKNPRDYDIVKVTTTTTTEDITPKTKESTLDATCESFKEKLAKAIEDVRKMK